MAPLSGGFDPFTDRLSRDLRNTMSRALLAALDKQDPEPFEAVARDFRGRWELSPAQVEYLTARLACYRSVIAQSSTDPDADRVALLLWDHELFFEFHELLEKRWLMAAGIEKEVLQALIRAAGSYVHRRHGHVAGATKMAARARQTIEKYRDHLPPGFAAEPLLAGLDDPAAPSPRFGVVAATDDQRRHGVSSV